MRLNLLTSLITATTILTTVFPASAESFKPGINNSNQYLIAANNCNVLESVQPLILNAVNNNVAGYSHRINRRKRLVINHLKDISFNGCRVNIAMDVTLKRKIRRDARGTVKMRADITDFSFVDKRLCYQNARVTDVNLSRTLSIGEAAYKWVANKALPNGQCLRF